MAVLFLIGSVLLGLLIGRIAHFQLPDGSVEVVLYLLVALVGLDLSKEKIEKDSLRILFL